MEILKTGNPERISEKKQFGCKRCGCFFVAQKTECEGVSQMEWLDMHVSFKCKCPTCGNMVYG